VLNWRGCHAKILHPSEAKSKGQLFTVQVPLPSIV
jgi:hypothetical protein